MSSAQTRIGRSRVSSDPRAFRPATPGCKFQTIHEYVERWRPSNRTQLGTAAIQPCWLTPASWRRSYGLLAQIGRHVQRQRQQVLLISYVGRIRGSGNGNATRTMRRKYLSTTYRASIQPASSLCQYSTISLARSLAPRLLDQLAVRAFRSRTRVAASQGDILPCSWAQRGR